MTSCRISVVIPAYRAARTILRAIDSVFAQTVPPAEIIVIDDGSPEPLDGTLSPVASRVRLIRKANGGAASARNVGIEASTSPLIAFLDADDYWEPDKLQRQLEVLSRHPDVGLVASAFRERAPEPGATLFLRDGRPFAGSVLRPQATEVLDVASRIMTSTVLLRRDVLGTLRFDCGLQTAEDRDLWLRMLLRAPCYILPAPLVTIVLAPGSLSRADADTGYGPMIEVARRYAGLLGARRARNAEAGIFRSWAAAHLGNGRPRRAVRPAWCRVVRQPASPEGWWVLLKSGVLACVPTAPPDARRRFIRSTTGELS